MRRLLWLLAGSILAGYGLGLIAGADAFWPYVVRDGLLVALAGGLIFAAHTGPLPVLLVGRRAWPPPAQIALATGVACSLAATGVLALLGSRGWPAWLGGSLWALALGLWAAALIWPGAADYALPAYRWTRDAAGRMVRLALEGTSAERSIPLPIRSRGLNLALLAVLGMGWALRLWRLAALPPDCLDVECAQALRLVDGSWWRGLDAASAGLHALTAAAIYRIGGDALLALRAAAALIGCATLPVFYWAARAYVSRAGALLGLALLAFSPWHLWASRTGDAWTAAPLLLLVALGAAGRAAHTAELRWWGLAGGTLGLLAAQPLPLQAATGLYALGVAATGGWAMRREEGKAARSAVWMALGSSLAVGLPLALSAWRSQSAAAAGEAGWWSGLAALLHGGGAALALFVESPLLPPLAGALAIAGLLALLWRRRDLRGPLVLLGLAIYGVAAGVDGARLPGLGLLTWLPFLYVGAAVALDQLVTAFDAAWARLVALPSAVAAALVLLLAVLGPDVLALQQQWRTLSGSGQGGVEVAMGRYLAQCLSAQAVDVTCARTGESDPVYFVPPAVLAHPSTQLLLGTARDTAYDTARVRPLDVGRDLLPTSSPQSDLVYLVAMDNQPLIDLLQQLYPGAQVHAEPRDQAGPTLFLVYAISQQEVLSHQGLAGTYSSSADASSSEVNEIRLDGPLRFAWANDPPLEPPFEVVWEGSLLASALLLYVPASP